MRTMIFSDFAVPNQERIQLYRDCRFSDVILGVTNDTKQFKLIGTEKKWLDACGVIDSQGMKTHLMSWTLPSAAYMEQALTVLPAMAKRVGSSSILFNAEKEWREGSSTGIRAAADVVRQYKSTSDSLDVGIVGIAMGKAERVLSEVCDYIIPEAYSIWKPARLCGPSGHHWSHTWHTFPGPQQRRCYEEWWAALPTKRFTMGLACYWGDRPQMGSAPALSEAQSMRYAMAETIAIWHEVVLPSSPHPKNSFQGVAYWSGKHLVGSSPVRRDRQDFMRMISEA